MEIFKYISLANTYSERTSSFNMFFWKFHKAFFYAVSVLTHILPQFPLIHKCTVAQSIQGANSN